MSKKLNTTISSSLPPNTTINVSSGTGGVGAVLVNNSGNISWGNGITFNSPKKTYHVLGEDVEVSSGYRDGNTAIMIATLNVLGKPYLEELHKNNVFFPTEIEEYLKKKFKWIERDKKIDDIIN